MLKHTLTLLALLALAGCQLLPPATTGKSAPGGEMAGQGPPAWLSPLQARTLTLPGAQVTAAGDELTIAYPGASLFAAGAVLPLPGGAEVLDPLSDLLAAFPTARWNGTVRAATPHSSEYDGELAAKRAELLQRYFTNRGIAAGTVNWQSGAGDGAPLTLELQTVQWRSGTSSGAKE